MLVAAGLVAWSSATATDLGAIALVAGGFAWLMIAVGSGFGMPAPIALGTAGLVAAYGVSRVGREGLDVGAAGAAAAIFLVLEFTIWSLELRYHVPGWRRRHRADWYRTALLLAAAGTIAAVVLYIATLPLEHGVLVQAAGAAAAAGLLAFLVALRRSPD